jgi:hypothetical protein
VLAAGLPAETQRVAAFAIAHLGTDTPADWWRTAIDQRLTILAANPGRPAESRTSVASLWFTQTAVSFVAWSG